MQVTRTTRIDTGAHHTPTTTDLASTPAAGHTYLWNLAEGWVRGTVPDQADALLAGLEARETYDDWWCVWLPCPHHLWGTSL
jgi:hypothetical protein